MNRIMNRILNRGGCFHNFQKLAKMAICQKKNPPGGQSKTHPKGVDPTPPVLNENCAWIPWQEQNPLSVPTPRHRK